MAGISVLRIVISLLAGVVLISSITFFFKQYAFSRAVLLITYAILLFALPLWRIIAKLFFNIGIERHLSKARTLIVGSENRANDLIKKLKSNVNDIHNIIGLIGFRNDEIDKEVNGVKIKTSKKLLMTKKLIK
jgi:FlaA1/EpsC-like NDP-sugar epimerase